MYNCVVLKYANSPQRVLFLVLEGTQHFLYPLYFIVQICIIMLVTEPPRLENESSCVTLAVFFWEYHA